MPTAEILTIGSELIEGLRTNTNATWLARRLTSAGIQVTQITSVADIVDDVVDVIRSALARMPNVLIITGGLGPTIDDRTCEAVALATRRKLVLSPAALRIVELSYKQMHARGLVRRKGLSSARRKMAYTPRGAIALPNPVGTAPGIQLKQEKTLIICLPGVPAEMRAIFKKHVHKNLMKLSGQVQHRVSINVQGIDEATLAPLLERLARKFRGLDVRSYPSGKGIRGRIGVLLVSPTAAEVKDAKETLNKWLSEFRLSSSR
ncbi:MAG: hypothetical protein AVW06_04125 [Hadesarchaea archaeon DG-33-1]|nr:MAG: hypothetical protein AVW06_04125 [Hadesarchaea archaeon DG-33-1]